MPIVLDKLPSIRVFILAASFSNINNNKAK